MLDFETLRKEALFYLKKGTMKDFVVHTQGVMKAMEMLVSADGGDKTILIPAAILHDVGWARVPNALQTSSAKEDKEKAMRLHIELAPGIIREILNKLDYENEKIERIIDIVSSHKFKDPSEKEKQMLIDADGIACAFKEEFWSNVKAYSTTPEEHYQYRKREKFYSESAKRIFEKELKNRKKEIEMGDHLLDIVNENDEVVGQELKSLKLKKNFISRVVAIFIRNSEGKLLVCKRGAKEEIAAGLYDLAAFGNVESGESYIDAAKRELLEEVNIDTELRFLGKFYQEVEIDGKLFKIFVSIYIGTSDVTPETSEEIESWKWMRIEEIEKEMEANRSLFCPGFLNDFAEVREKLTY